VIPIQNETQFIQWIEQNVKLPSIGRVFTSGEAITAGKAVYMNVDGKIYHYTTANMATYIGVAEESNAIDCPVRVIMQGYIRVTGSSWGAGIVYYVQNGGTLVSSVADKKVAVGIGNDSALLFTDMGNGGSGPVTVADGYAKSLMLMGG
jgi:hypothetical protein